MTRAPYTPRLHRAAPPIGGQFPAFLGRCASGEWPGQKEAEAWLLPVPRRCPCLVASSLSSWPSGLLDCLAGSESVRDLCG